ncbi:Sec-independent protein translocase protein TatB [Thalassospira sp.]|uniref:Sec-independent protein translocase protein TatB n=1 Tax=Thalassospira sp. TaxID=1912094 RepID=UPI0027368F2D|nr:Sec-independent protein translocase protein TatB [Thalassospira sp.]MDP2697967.1 Sec-independent protein translocase protein TatB [Thalassospira sp.]
MFDIGWTEMALVAIVALFVVGPKDLPHVLYKLAGYWKKMRGMAREFQGGIDNIIREAELDDLRKQVTSKSSPTDFLEKHIGEGADKKPAPKKEPGASDIPASVTDSDQKKPGETPVVKNDKPEKQA